MLEPSRHYELGPAGPRTPAMTSGTVITSSPSQPVSCGPQSMPALREKERQEIVFWRDSPNEMPGSESLDNLVNKFGDLGVFLETLRHHESRFSSATRVLELGGGQGWASCAIKSLFPRCKVVATDISPYAVASLPAWEHLLATHLEGALACRSYVLPIRSGSVDLVFAFQSAHHFVAHRRTLSEVHRVLRPSGVCLYLHEPTCRAPLHSIARWRVNRKRPEVPEDVLIYNRLKRLATQAGFRATSQFDVSLTKRGPMELVYYSVLRLLKPLQHLLPCTQDFVLIKAP